MENSSNRLILRVPPSVLLLSACLLLPAGLAWPQSPPIEPHFTWPNPSKGADAAPVVVVVFSDFESSTCERSASVLSALPSQTNQVRILFKNAPSASNPNSFLAHEAALAAGAQGKFWEMHDLLFHNQTKLLRPDLEAYAASLQLDMASFRFALDYHLYAPLIERDLAEAKGLAVSRTPTFFVNGRRLVGPQGYASLGAVVSAVIAGVPKSARVSDLAASGPARSINLDHAPTEGPSTAPVTLVEFSDFECPYCAQDALTVHQLLSLYPTQLRFAFKHYPLPIHKDALLAHEAAMAAGEQGKFWEMHALLFATQSGLAHDELIEKAKMLKLDIPRFTRDLDSHRFRAAVESDRQEGNRLGIDGTPYFFINGRAISGVVSLSEFRALIDEALRNVEHGK